MASDQQQQPRVHKSTLGQWEAQMLDSLQRAEPAVTAEAAAAACSPLATANLTSLEAAANLRVPLHPAMQCLESRRLSIPGACWPLLRIPSDVIVEAGFFYFLDCRGGGREPQDVWRCFSCGLVVKTWRAKDNPWLEHARWSPRCAHLLATRGANFVLEVQSRVPPHSWSLLASTETSICEVAEDASPSLATRAPISSSVSQMESLSHQCAYLTSEYDDTPEATNLVRLGFSKLEVSQALSRRVAAHPDATFDSEVLLSDLLHARPALHSAEQLAAVQNSCPVHMLLECAAMTND